MILTELFKVIGIDLKTRNFMVDYCNSKGNHFDNSKRGQSSLG